MSARRVLLMPLVPLYSATVRWKRRLFEEGRLQAKRLPGVVISVGSVSAGGAGKTPMVLLLAEVLREREYAVRILTRGYGRGAKVVERVDPAGDAGRYGDEPLLLARRTGLPVYVGADRFRAGMLGERMPAGGTVVQLLDDGFQHRQLYRDLDIVLLTRKDADDVLLPAGNLREPLVTLRKADVLVVRDDEAESLRDLLAMLTREGGSAPVWLIRRSLRLGTDGEVRVPRRPVAFCGIARPESFFAMLEKEGQRTAATMQFRDHHRYGRRDIARLLEKAKRSEADGFVTTEKDAVKLPAQMRSQLEQVGPLVAPELRVELVDEQAALEQMIAMVPLLNRRKGR